MKILKTCLPFVFVCAAVLAHSQALPPPAYNGQSYWFGPGPSSASVISSSQTDGGYAEMIGDLNTGDVSAGVSGGPAFTGFSGGTPAPMTASFLSKTTVTIEPYVYIDGYFSVSCDISGFGSAGPIDLGASRFFIIHNDSIELDINSVSKLFPGGNVNAVGIPLTLHVSLSDYKTSASVYTNTIVGGSGGSLTFLDPTIYDDVIAQVDLDRTMDLTGLNPNAGQYIGTAVVAVKAF